MDSDHPQCTAERCRTVRLSDQQQTGEDIHYCTTRAQWVWEGGSVGVCRKEGGGVCGREGVWVCVGRRVGVCVGGSDRGSVFGKESERWSVRGKESERWVLRGEWEGVCRTQWEGLRVEGSEWKRVRVGGCDCGRECVERSVVESVDEWVWKYCVCWEGESVGVNVRGRRGVWEGVWAGVWKCLMSECDRNCVLSR